MKSKRIKVVLLNTFNIIKNEQIVLIFDLTNAKAMLNKNYKITFEIFNLFYVL